MELDQQLCYCFHINKRKIVNFVKRERPKRASQISECFGAGTGCGWCVPFLKEIHRQIVAGEAIEPGSITAEEYEKMRGGYLKDIKTGTRERISVDARISVACPPQAAMAARMIAAAASSVPIPSERSPTRIQINPPPQSA